MYLPLIYTHSITVSFEFLLIIALFVYIIYLHFTLAKKNILLKTCFEKIEKNSSKLDKKDIIQFLENIKNPDYKKSVTKDRILDKKINNFIFEDESEIKLFLHYTPSKKIVDKIIKEGFMFTNSFYKTAEYIYNDELYLVQRHHEHKQFGDYVIVICISKKIFNIYSDKLNEYNLADITVEQILTESNPIVDDNNDLIYTLPQQFIKGYFNFREGTIVKNKSFDFNYNSKLFDKNLDKYK
ncbi:MAG: hypothetical protein JEY96_02655 [Bacteroidales bacterium]|nr:hypothetical protein [Bacteroidales bacterium]